ncbi:hypothetical protein BO99DRAFT_120217 [Aspergillus violaceofuscus CBS 115571]|uniref:Uncharacterized protein n=1 Tax=Aspergillus violaceofuscus (strain CBS 115571) TaxID=1450538 RepID=A0A2V5H6V5_ASPV1|nr:hypothetical protein BO99DRAFT_120217 [Aspergillus violaceofuscus CBS 115571]
MFAHPQACSGIGCLNMVECDQRHTLLCPVTYGVDNEAIPRSSPLARVNADYKCTKIHAKCTELYRHQTMQTSAKLKPTGIL